MSIEFQDNQNFISTVEAAKLSFRTLKSVRDWCKKNAHRTVAFKHANKWYLDKNKYLASIEGE